MVNQYTPDVVSPPGHTLKEVLIDRGIPLRRVCQYMGIKKRIFRGILNGKQQITPEIAKRLEILFGVEESFWNNLEANYQEYLLQKYSEKKKGIKKLWKKNQDF